MSDDEAVIVLTEIPQVCSATATLTAPLQPPVDPAKSKKFFESFLPGDGFAEHLTGMHVQSGEQRRQKHRRDSKCREREPTLPHLINPPVCLTGVGRNPNAYLRRPVVPAC